MNFNLLSEAINFTTTKEVLVNYGTLYFNLLSEAINFTTAHTLTIIIWCITYFNLLSEAINFTTICTSDKYVVGLLISIFFLKLLTLRLQSFCFLSISLSSISIFFLKLLTLRQKERKDGKV